MPIVELNLTQETIDRARRLAQARNSTVKQVLADMLERSEELPEFHDPITGLFSDDAELLDEIVEEAMKAREMRLP